MSVCRWHASCNFFKFASKGQLWPILIFFLNRFSYRQLACTLSVIGPWLNYGYVFLGIMNACARGEIDAYILKMGWACFPVDSSHVHFLCLLLGGNYDQFFFRPLCRFVRRKLIAANIFKRFRAWVSVDIHYVFF